MTPARPCPKAAASRGAPAPAARPRSPGRPRGLALAALPALWLAGCAATPSGAPLPAAPPPAQWQAPAPVAAPGDAAPAGAAPAAADAGWWARFDDPLLPPLIEAAQAASPTLAAAAARIARARALRAGADTDARPQAGLGLRATQGRGTPGAPVAFSAAFGVQAAWEVDLFGGLAAARGAAAAREDAAGAGWHEARAAVAAETATSYLALRACQAQQALTATDVRSREETARLADLSARAGLFAPGEAALARAGAATARGQLTAVAAQCQALLKSLVELTAGDEPQLQRRLAAGTGRLPLPAPLALPAVPAQALAQRPDLFAAARAVEAAAADRARSAARERPQLRLAGELGPALLRVGGDRVDGTIWTIGPMQVVFPSFGGGARRAETAAAQAEYEAAVAEYRAQMRRAVREVETALVQLQATAEGARDAELAARDYEAALRATAARQAGGLASMFELEDARRTAVAAQLRLLELQRERAAGWIALYRALGGGWSEAELGRAATAQAPAAK